MRKMVLGAVLGVAVLATPVAYCRERLRDKIMEKHGLGGEKWAEGEIAKRMQSDIPHKSIAYGNDKRQNVDLYRLPKTATFPPLVVFVHGGGWRRGNEKLVDDKPEYFTSLGYAFASIGYRMLPDTHVEQQAEDVGAAIRMLHQRGRELGFDPDRIILVGHSAGAHLVSMMGTNPVYTANAFSAIRGVLPIDGAGYDVALQMKQSPFISKKLYEPAFGTDPARQRALSPITYAGAPDVRSWFMLYSSERRDSPKQNQLLAAAVKRGGAETEMLALPLGHGPINIKLGTKGYKGNTAIEKWLAKVAR